MCIIVSCWWVLYACCCVCRICLISRGDNAEKLGMTMTRNTLAYQTQALITALRLGRTTWLGSMYDSTDLVDNYYKLFTTIMVNLQTI